MFDAEQPTPGLYELDERREFWPALLALNNAHAVELSVLSSGRMARLVGGAFMAGGIGEADAFLIAFDQDADYDSPNFVWFRDRYTRFVYVDRIVVAATGRGKGLARRLYGALFARAARAGHERVVCEVNAEPPNPASDAFHASLGFEKVGSAVLSDSKALSYFSKSLPEARCQGSASAY